MMATYSAFFSSGLLAAPQHVQVPPLSLGVQTALQSPQDTSMLSPKDTNSLSTYFNFEYSTSPGRPSSPMPLPDDSDIEVDDDEKDSSKARRSVTPTPANLTAFPSTNSSTTEAQPRPKLRKRRSSLTIGTSSLSAIRSPARTAANASAALRARSGSVGAVAVDVFNPTVASEGTSLVGRMRSGSVGAVAFRKRNVRRAATAPSAPPPTSPLPPLPPVPDTYLMAPTRDNAPRSAPLCGTFNMNVVSGARAVYEKKGRQRGMSGTLAQATAGMEEIKEN